MSKSLFITDTLNQYVLQDNKQQIRQITIEPISMNDFLHLCYYTKNDRELGICIQHNILKDWIYAKLTIPSKRTCAVPHKDICLKQGNSVIVITLSLDTEQPTSCAQYQELYYQEKISFMQYSITTSTKYSTEPLIDEAFAS